MKDSLKSIKKIIFDGKLRRLWIILIDFCVFSLINLFYYLLAGEAAYSTPVDNGVVYFYNSVILIVCIFLCRFAVRMYKNIWRYTNTRAYFTIVLTDAAGGVAAVVISRIIACFVSGFYLGIWHSVTVASLTALLTLMSRFSYRLIYKYLHNSEKKSETANQKLPIAIIGAGQLGVYLANELAGSPNSKYDPKCFIDTDKTKIGNRISGLRIYGETDAKETLNKYRIKEVVIAISGVDSKRTEALWSFYSALGCKIKIYATPLTEEGRDTAGQKRVIRDFSIEDLLFRKPLNINNQAEFDFYRGKTVLVTGGGGSIGSELCRQLAKCGLKKLVIFDIYENNAYDIQQELIRKYGTSLDLSVEIGSVRDPIRLDCIFKTYLPDIVFHAAAHKHVPLMEHSGCEAIKNNVIGTYNTANCAEKYKVKKFILVSTDKAVNPTNIMGASKRLCEMVIQCRADSETNFAAVRFGNVLGSNGSVIPLFKRQILSGGPVTITDKRIIRYFMTIPEASQLVIQAGAKAEKGELFVLDMGQPVRIYDLAVNMIKLMGYEPDVDIKIEEVGLRPGEKLFEELLMKSEDLQKTDNDMIFIERDAPYTREQVEEKLSILRRAVDDSRDTVDSTLVKLAIKKVVPTFIDPEEVNKTADESEEMKNVKKEPVTV